jgi:hypothetical protein
VDPDQLAGADASLDRSRAHPEPQELSPRDVSVLPTRQPRDPLIDLVRIATHIDQ